MNPAWSIILFTTIGGLRARTWPSWPLPWPDAVWGRTLGKAFVGADACWTVGSRSCWSRRWSRPSSISGHPDARMAGRSLMWRTSWMSREVIVLPAYIVLMGAWALLAALHGAASRWKLVAQGAGRCSAIALRGSAAVAVHGDDLRLHPLHPGVGTPADGR
jgi:hypothetical protein